MGNVVDLLSLALTLNRNITDHLHFIRRVFEYGEFSVVSFGLMRIERLEP